MLGTAPGGPGPSALSDLERKDIAIGISMIEAGAYAQAYKAFKKISRPNASALFGLALCHMAAEEHQSAIGLLERTLQMIPLVPKDTVTDETYRKLHSMDSLEDNHKKAFGPDVPNVLPQYARECVLRCLVDSYLAAGMYDKVRATASALGNTEYENVKEALSAVSGK